jgi:hypothetical protein
LDPTFGQNGAAGVNVRDPACAGSLARYCDAGTSDAAASGMTLLADGSLVLSGAGSSQGINVFGLAKLRSDGSLDPTFGTQGLVLTEFPDPTSSPPSATALGPDGKLVIAGWAYVGGARGSEIARFCL